MLGYPEDCWSPTRDGAAPLGTEPSGGGSLHCSQIGKTGLCEALPKVTQNSLLRNTFLLKFVHDNSLVLSSLKD